MKERYLDIINLPHYEPKHKRMTIENRAAQFAPFAALTGYAEAIAETSRLTETLIEITNEQKIIINDELQMLQKNLIKTPKISIIYFIPDKLKKGGKYIEKNGNVKKIDFFKNTIILTDNTIISIDKIIKINSDL